MDLKKSIRFLSDNIKDQKVNESELRLLSLVFAGKVDTAVFNRLQAEHMEYLKEVDELDNS